MYIDKFEEAIMNCRFCFMCRHLSAIGNVRFTEVDTPRIRAAMLYGLRTGTNSFDDEDFVDALYRQDLSACCVHHCVNHYDENGLALAARADVVEAGKAPEAVKKLAAKFVKSVGWKAEGTGDVAWFLDETTAADKAVVAATKKLFAAAKVSPKIITGGSIGKALKVLGFLPEAKAAAEQFAAFLKAEGVKTLLVSNPAAASALKQDYRSSRARSSASRASSSSPRSSSRRPPARCTPSRTTSCATTSAAVAWTSCSPPSRPSTSRSARTTRRRTAAARARSCSTSSTPSSSRSSPNTWPRARTIRRRIASSWLPPTRSACS